MTDLTDIMEPVSNDTEFGSWVAQCFGHDATVPSLDTIAVDMPNETFDKIKSDSQGFLQFVAEYIADTLARRSTQREYLRHHVKTILEVLKEGNLKAREKAAEAEVTLEEYLNKVPPAKFIHEYTKVLLYASMCERAKMLEAIEVSNESFENLLTWGEDAADTEGEYLAMANHLKLIYQGNTRLVKDMDDLDMFTRKNTQRLRKTTVSNGEEGHLMPINGTEIIFPLSVMRVYDRVFLDDDEDPTKFDTFIPRKIVDATPIEGGQTLKVADWCHDIIMESGGLEPPFTRKTFVNFRI